MTRSLKNWRKTLGKKWLLTGYVMCGQWQNWAKALVLLVEKDYHSVGYVDPSNEVKLYLNPPLGKHQVITDAVEEIISTVIEKKGDIVVVENGMLEKYGRIALLLRYP